MANGKWQMISDLTSPPIQPTYQLVSISPPDLPKTTKNYQKLPRITGPTRLYQALSGFIRPYQELP
jgi:hypothetical protein